MIKTLVLLAALTISGSAQAEPGQGLLEDAAAAWERGDFSTTATNLHTACNAGDPLACSNLGVLYATGKGVPRSDERAAQLYGTACSAGIGIACSNLGWFQEWGMGGLRADPAEAAGNYQRACSAGTGVACRNLGVLHAVGKGVSRDTGLAVRYLTQALALDPRLDSYEIQYP